MTTIHDDDDDDDKDIVININEVVKYYLRFDTSISDIDSPPSLVRSSHGDGCVR